MLRKCHTRAMGAELGKKTPGRTQTRAYMKCTTQG
eukprot:CAMPEP_0206057794 /NCGR_PEP_ID=MMETSP1466-20131121/45144_1 /ASSEMBLY_ACC=CAM_ASM_001126 /TAXON_ID=44452 /ORGANISM="Pavlova gyrans, Strain CCMP608" /LENGTH=34 /DNA_ID= /DNA_START= /DNA_END= /DNA_ORIENTATION=